MPAACQLLTRRRQLFFLFFHFPPQVEARYNNVRELYAKRHTVKATGMLRKIFYAPGVMGLSDLDGDSAKAADADADALEFSRVKYLADPVSGTLVISLTYLRSHFCFQPSGTAVRRAWGHGARHAPRP